MEPSSSDISLSPHPIPSKERIEFLDILRGFALFGILVVNMSDFNFPTEHVLPGQYWHAPIDRITGAVVAFFFNEKFYSLFSLLFGIGFGLQISRWKEKGKMWYVRRLGILLIIGLLHGIFVWWGDVLAVYAVLGMILFLFRAVRPPWIFSAALVCLLLPMLLSSFLLFSGRTPGAVQGEPERPASASVRGEAEPLIAMYAQGSYTTLLSYRLIQLKANYTAWLSRNYGAQVFGMFLTGLFFVKIGLIQNIRRFLPEIRRAWNVLFIALCAVLLTTLLTGKAPGTDGFGWRVFVYELEKINRTILCLLYAASIILCLQSKAGEAALRFLAPAGRMALTNYLMQSILCTLLFYGYGFGIYGAVPPFAGLILTCVIFAGQLVMSSWWMRRFRFGPVEWVWRSLTYGAAQPMKREGNL